MKRYFYIKSHPPIRFIFSHNSRDFIVDEIPLYEFSGAGEHLILRIRKKNLTTHELIKILANALHIRQTDIGYAGMKDKNALAYQHFSVPLVSFKSSSIAHLSSLDSTHSKHCDSPIISNHKNFKILESIPHKNKLKIGHLKGNRFFIRLKKVDSFNLKRLSEELDSVILKGFPNFFGYQRFGSFGDNFLSALEIKKPIKKQSSLEKLMLSSLQSHFFNLWLESRLKISSIINSFDLNLATQALLRECGLTLSPKIIRILQSFSSLSLVPLPGDVLMHYPHGKLFYFGHSNDLDSKGLNSGDLDLKSSEDSHLEQHYKKDLERLKRGEVTITGLLSGEGCERLESKKPPKVWLSKDDAFVIEREFCHNIMAHGTRRYAWVYPSDVELKYDKRSAIALLSFTLPSGAYATNFLQYIKNGDLSEF